MRLLSVKDEMNLYYNQSLRLKVMQKKMCKTIVDKKPIELIKLLEF